MARTLGMEQHDVPSVLSSASAPQSDRPGSCSGRLLPFLWAGYGRRDGQQDVTDFCGAPSIYAQRGQKEQMKGRSNSAVTLGHVIGPKAPAFPPLKPHKCSQSRLLHIEHRIFRDNHPRTLFEAFLSPGTAHYFVSWPPLVPSPWDAINAGRRVTGHETALLHLLSG